MNWSTLSKYVKVTIEPWPEYSGGFGGDKYQVTIREWDYVSSRWDYQPVMSRPVSTGKVGIWYTKTRWGAKLYAWRTARRWKREERRALREEYTLDY